MSSHRGLTRLEIAALVAGILALNVSAAVIYKLKFKAPSTPAPTAAVTPPPPAPAPTPPPDQDQEKFRAFRGAGLSALSQGNYDTAVEQFTQALRFGKADSDIMELLKMAKEFQDKQKAEPPVEVAVAPTPAKPSPAPAPAPAPRVAKREAARRQEPQEKEKKEEGAAVAPQPGTLLITSSPTGLVVEVDGARKDLTPAKVSVAAGSHVVSLWKGESRLFQKTVTAEAGQVALVDADVSAQLAPPPESAKPQPVAVAPAAPLTPAPAAVAAVAAAPAPEKAPVPAPPAPAPTSPVAEAATGELQIQSLNVYGEVFVNGKSVGFPPVVAKGLPASQATIEVRVDGSVRRKRVVDVVANKRTTVRIP